MASRGYVNRLQELVGATVESVSAEASGLGDDRYFDGVALTMIFTDGRTLEIRAYADYGSGCLEAVIEGSAQ